MKHLSHVVGRGLVLGLIWILMGAPGALAADEPSKQGTAPSGDVQERSIQGGTFGGPLSPATKSPGTTTTGWYCKLSNKTCYCDRTKAGDCAQMKSMVCAGDYHDTSPLDGECTALR
jgi:hypothetical protein